MIFSERNYDSRKRSAVSLTCARNLTLFHMLISSEKNSPKSTLTQKGTPLRIDGPSHAL